MSPRTGRPTDARKEFALKVRVDAKLHERIVDYDFESREIFKCSAILLDYIEVVDNAIKKAVTKLAEYDTKLQKENARALSADSDKVDFGVTTDPSRNN